MEYKFCYEMLKIVNRFRNLFVLAWNLSFRFILLENVEFSKYYRQADVVFAINKLK